METERLSRMRELFDRALALPEAEREHFLTAASGGDGRLLDEVRSLLKARDQAGTFLERTFSAPPDLSDGIPPNHPGRIGAYRVIRELGRGGMGVVLLAVRDDGAFTKKVALKLIQDGIRDHEALGRFRAERQVLAALDHPDIARILDGGNTEAGTPYYVMEYVEGEPLDLYCNRKDLGLRARVRLFQQVCSAVDYLHGKQVLHRDLKPNNILITSEGIPKLLDFGIAKFLGVGAIDLTTAGRAPLTPRYASPEQLAGRPIGPSADVYSLGVILHLLLTDNLPNPLKLEAPSKTPPYRDAHIRERISRDLDLIVLKALALDPDRRYSSPEQLSSDLQRFLENRPTLARRSPLPVRIGKFVHRNRARTIVATLVLLLAAIGGWLAIDAIRQRRDVSEKDAKIQRLLDSIGQAPQVQLDVDPRTVGQIIAEVHRLRESLDSKWMESGKLTQNQVRLRKEVVDRSRRYLDSLQQVSERSPKAAREIGFAYIRLGELEQSSGQPQISNRPSAVTSFRAAARTLEHAAEMDPKDTDLRHRLAEVERQLATLGANTPGSQQSESVETGTLPERPAGPETRTKPNDQPPFPAAAPTLPRRSSTLTTIAEFRADPPSVRPGQSVRLYWTVNGDVSDVWLTPGGSMPRNAKTFLVSPGTTTNYI